MVVANESVEIPNPDPEDEGYEPIEPIKNIDFGFYVVPQSADFTSYMTSVD